MQCALRTTNKMFSLKSFLFPHYLETEQQVMGPVLVFELHRLQITTGPGKTGILQGKI